MSVLRTVPLGERLRILLIRLSSIGDVIVTTPVTRVLRQALPEATIAWAVESLAADMVRGNPYLDDVLVWERRRSDRWTDTLRSGARFLRRLRGQFDVVIDFQGNARSAFLAWGSGARYRIGNAGAREYADRLYTHRVPRPLELSSRQRCLDLLQPLGIHSRDRRMVVAIGEMHRAAADRLLAAAEAGHKKYACLAPATTWAHKHWTEAGWAATAEQLWEQLGLMPVWLGSGNDLPLLERIRSQTRSPSLLLAGQTSLKEAAALLHGASLAVAVDTALMHMAVAVGTPTVGVCGASYWPGFRDYERFRLVHQPLPCSPCLRHPTCRNIDCMQAIGPADILVAARSLLDGLPRVLAG